MSDILAREKRSRDISRIKGKDTKLKECELKKAPGKVVERILKFLREWS